MCSSDLTLRRFEGYIHGFISGAGVSRSIREAVLEIGAMTRGAFDLTAATATLQALPAS